MNMCVTFKSNRVMWFVRYWCIRLSFLVVAAILNTGYIERPRNMNSTKVIDGSGCAGHRCHSGGTAVRQPGGPVCDDNERTASVRGRGISMDPLHSQHYLRVKSSFTFLNALIFSLISRSLAWVLLCFIQSQVAWTTCLTSFFIDAVQT